MSITQTAAKYPAPIIFGAAADKLDKEMLIRCAIWAGCATAADALTIYDYDSTAILYDGLGEANADRVLWGLKGQRVDGINITVMGSGQLLIYL